MVRRLRPRACQKLSSTRRIVVCAAALLLTPICLLQARTDLPGDDLPENAYPSADTLFLQPLFNAIPVAVFYKDRDGVYLGCNEVFTDIVGVSNENIRGKTVHELWPGDLAEIYHQADLDLMKNPEHQVYEFKIRDKDGHLRPVMFGKKVFLDAQGEVAGIVGAFVDITELRQAEAALHRRTQWFLAGCGLLIIALLTMIVRLVASLRQRKLAVKALRASEDRLSTFVANHPGVVFALDKDGVFLLSEGRDLAKLGLAPGEVVGRSVFVFYQDIPEIGDASRLALAGKSQSRAVTVGSLVFECWIGPITDEKGRIGGAIGIASDITDRKKSEQEREHLQAQLAQAQKMESIGRLAGGIAHDFNNMLAVILGNSELALKKLDPDHPLRAELGDIQHAAERSARLTRQLLAFARKQKVTPQAIDLNATVSGMLSMLRRLIGENVELIWRPARNLWAVNMDPAQTDQILANLCVNARDAIDRVGQVVIETANVCLEDGSAEWLAGGRPGEYVRLTVSDNGEGMDAETMAHLFEPFFTTKQIGSGTGLGLSTVYGAVNQNGGFVRVSSVLGEGTAFYIYIPRHTTVPQPDQRELSSAGRGHETILLVEDEEALLKVTATLLTDLGYRVLTASTPAEALRLFSDSSGRIDLVLTDIIMPEMNGRDLVKEIQSRCPEIRALFMSGYAHGSAAPEGVMEGGLQYMQKPFTGDQLASELRKILDPTRPASRAH